MRELPYFGNTSRIKEISKRGKSQLLVKMRKVSKTLKTTRQSQTISAMKDISQKNRHNGAENSRSLSSLSTDKQNDKVLNMSTINPNLVEMKYAVRGLVPTTAGIIAKDLQKNPGKYPFKEILYCNIGNPQSVGQNPIKWYRDVLALVDAPHLLDKPNINKLFTEDVIKRAKNILSDLPNGTGAYTNSVGAPNFIRKVAEFIEKRDGYPASEDHIVLSNGASSAIDLILTALISSEEDGILIPIPQYPIYSALIKILNGTQLNYNLIEEKGWSLDMEDIRKSVKEAREKGVKPRAMVIINPGNPTGSVIPYEQLQQLVKFCKEERMMILSDEVYQENIYNPEQKFHSLKKVVRDLGKEYDDFEFISFHSTSKGLIGECGRRGGYMEVCGMDEEVYAQVVKLQSSRLCSNLDGQVMMSLMVDPPKQGEESYDFYLQQKKEIFASLKRKSHFVYEALNSVPGITCQPLEGAMYAFPQIEMPVGALEAADSQKTTADTLYALSLLNETGICCVPGSGFGQKEGTHHIRLTFLPEEEKLKTAMESFKKHHKDFMLKYQGSRI